MTSRHGRRAAWSPGLFRISAEAEREDRSRRLPDATEIAEINATHLIGTPLKSADLLFVFGTRENVGRRVDEACRLWREGFFRWSIVSGGVTPGSEILGVRDHQERNGGGRYPG